MLCWLAQKAVFWWVCTLHELSIACASSHRQHSFTRIYAPERQKEWLFIVHYCQLHLLLVWYDWHVMVVSAGLGLPLGLLGCVLIPLLPCLLLLHQRNHLDSPDVKRRLAFLFCSYRSVPVDSCFLCGVKCCMHHISLSSQLPRTLDSRAAGSAQDAIKMCESVALQSCSSSSVM